MSKGTGAGARGGGAEEEGTRGAEEEALGPRTCVLRVPGKMIEGSPGFQQFFRIYAKLMAGLKDSNVKESGTTPLAINKAVMRARKLSLEELDWAIYDI